MAPNLIRQLLGAHFILFLNILWHCRSQAPRLLIGAHIILEDVLGEEIRLPYRKYRHWGNFIVFLQDRFKNNGSARSYVGSGQFRLYDYQGYKVQPQRWHELVPNSKATMSIIIGKLFDRNACPRCFKVENDTIRTSIRWYAVMSKSLLNLLAEVE